MHAIKIHNNLNIHMPSNPTNGTSTIVHACIHIIYQSQRQVKCIQTRLLTQPKHKPSTINNSKSESIFQHKVIINEPALLSMFLIAIESPECNSNG